MTDTATRCDALVHAGEALAERPIVEIIAALAAACARWRDPVDPARREAERALSDHHGVPRAAIARVLDAGFAPWTEGALLDRAETELGDAGALDGFVALGSARRMALGPRLAVAFASRGVPTTPVGDVVDLLSVKAPIWLKPAAGSDDLAVRFAGTLAEIDPGIGAAIEVSGWPRGARQGREVLGAADLVMATGRRGTLAAIEQLAPEGARLVLHGPRLSAAVVTRSALESDVEGCVGALADDVAFAGQAGCLSPVVAWVEGGGQELLEALHAACVERWPAPARREGEPGERAAWAEWAAVRQVERAAGAPIAVIGDQDSGWSIEWRPEAGPPAPPSAPRILAIAPLADPIEAVDLCARARGTVASVGVAGTAAEIERLTMPLARAGVERVTPLGRMQRPPAGWRRDGRPSIADLVRWVDREG
ncbi:MAG TPA: acyl-CoA reductase [Gemmatimonadota bacterium]|nr:acyl-CoA reductase [Gemmatimonadota bacterium]